MRDRPTGEPDRPCYIYLPASKYFTDGQIEMAPNAIEQETAPRLRTAVGKLSRLLRRTDAGSGVDLTPTLVAVLLNADRLGPIRLAEIGEREGLNPTLLSRSVAQLTADGLIERSADPEDRRSAWIEATSSGHAVAAKIRGERTVAVQGALDELDDADRELIELALPALERLAQALASDGR